MREMLTSFLQMLGDDEQFDLTFWLTLKKELFLMKNDTT